MRVLPYAPLVELLADLARREGPESGHAVGRTGAPRQLGRLVPALLKAPRRRSGRRTHALLLFQGMASVPGAARACSVRTLVVVEDLHWADPSTRELLALLVEQLRGRVLLVLTVRTDEVLGDAGMGRFVAELTRRPSRPGRRSRS